MPRRTILTISSLSKDEIDHILTMAIDMKAHPLKYSGAMMGKTLLMLFEKPSLRTRVSFETGMTQLGGHAIFYSTADSPLGKKENIHDTAKCVSRYVNVVMARLNKRDDMRQLAQHADVPVINALDDFAHPCQMLADLQTIREKRGTFKGMKLVFCGDCKNNVTYDLMRCGALMGFTVVACGPVGPDYEPEKEVMDECAALCQKSGGKVEVSHDAGSAVVGADVIYVDSWMSYHISPSEKATRLAVFMPYQVNAALMAKTKNPNCIFMNCLPADRTAEQTAEVIDGPQSVVFDQAENRLHAQKSLLVFLQNQFEKK